MVVGFDISTKCIGYAVLNDDGSFHDVGYIWLDKIKGEYNKLDVVKDALVNSLKIVGDVSVFVEAPLKRSNNQNVVNILQRWNGMCCAVLYDHFKVHPVLIPELEVRKLNGIEVPKGVKGIDKKKYCLRYVQDLGIIDESKWQLKRTKNPCDWSYDMADATLVAKAGYEIKKKSIYSTEGLSL